MCISQVEERTVVSVALADIPAIDELSYRAVYIDYGTAMLKA